MIWPVILHLPGSSLCPWSAPVTIPGWISVEHKALIIWYDDVYTTSTTSTTTPSYTHITLTMARHAGGQTVTDPRDEWEDIDNVLHVVGWSVDTGGWMRMNAPACVQSLAIFVYFIKTEFMVHRQARPLWLETLPGHFYMFTQLTFHSLFKDWNSKIRFIVFHELISQFFIAWMVVWMRYKRFLL